MSKTALITRPEYDYTTRYISAWAERVIEEAEAHGFLVFDLKKDRAKRTIVESMLKSKMPALVFLNGHGDEDTVAGQDDEVIFAVGINESLLAGVLIYALSCRSAKVLGPQSVKQGARAYIGYQEDFYFMYSSAKRTRPDEDMTAALFLDPSNHIPTALVKGHDVQTAYLHAKRAFLRNIQKLLTSKASQEDSAALRYLVKYPFLWNGILKDFSAERQISLAAF